MSEQFEKRTSPTRRGPVWRAWLLSQALYGCNSGAEGKGELLYHFNAFVETGGTSG